MIEIAADGFLSADLIPGALYVASTSSTGRGNEVISQLLPGISNSGGFRPRASGGDPALVVLYSTGGEGDWPDHFDPTSGVFTYFGDNRKPGNDLHSTAKGGNRLLRKWFDDCFHGRNHLVPVILAFQRDSSSKGQNVRFIGLVVPGSPQEPLKDSLQIEIREHNDGQFENYKAKFTVLETGPISGPFIRESIQHRKIDWSDLRVPKALSKWRSEESLVLNDESSETTNSSIIDRMMGNRANIFTKSSGKARRKSDPRKLSNNLVGARPTIESLLIYRKLTYTPWFALGEFVDNSITSFVKHKRDNPDDPRFEKLRISISWDPGAQILTVEDNAAGIPFTEDGWGRALEVGSANPDPSVLGVHGYGMKAAGLWWSPAFKIESKYVDEPLIRIAQLDPERLIASDAEYVEIESRRSEDPSKHWTRLTLRGLNPGRTYPQGATLGKIRNYLSSMYRSYLRGDNWSRPDGSDAPFLEILIQGTPLEYEQPQMLEAPYWPNSGGPIDSKKILWRSDYTLQVPNPRAEESPDQPTFIEVPGWAGILLKFSRKDAGLYLSFRGKGIYGVAQGIQGVGEQYKPEIIFGAGSSFRQGRIFGEFDVSDYGKSATTDSAGWSDEEEQLFLVALNKALREDSKNLVTMAESFRVSTAGELSDREKKNFQRDVDETAKEAETIIGLKHESVTFGKAHQSAELPMLDEKQTFTASEDITLPTGHKAKFRTTFGSETDDWLLVYPNENGITEIVVNSNHPFMRRYFSGEKSVASAWQLALAIATAELDNSEMSQLRTEVNRWLELAGSYDFLNKGSNFGQ